MIKKDIENLTDVKLLVDTFYDQVKSHPLLRNIFNSRISDWSVHLEKMYKFWQTILLDQHTYTGSPFPPHATMPLTPTHFDGWLTLWKETIDFHFEGPKADDAKRRAEAIAIVFSSKIEYYKAKNLTSLI